jgi:hypothetical protein
MGHRYRYTDRHVQDLLEALEELLALPELAFLEIERPFDETLETIARRTAPRSLSTCAGRGRRPST